MTRPTAALASLLALFTVACSGNGDDSQPTFDARPQSDGSVTPAPDAPLATPDAAPGSPDAPLATPDAPAGTPDAAGAADAMTTQTCIPQCYIDIVGGLASQCPAELPCTSSFSLNGEMVTLTTCFYNNVKIVNVATAAGATTTFKKANGDTCYSLQSTIEGEGTVSILRNASGTEVARVIVEDASNGDEQLYQCGNNTPIPVDLSSPACQGQQADAGTGGGSCTNDNSCQP
jgi:hypothetical protein